MYDTLKQASFIHKEKRNVVNRSWLLICPGNFEEKCHVGNVSLVEFKSIQPMNVRVHKNHSSVLLGKLYSSFKVKFLIFSVFFNQEIDRFLTSVSSF